jgi:hypothetical protein
LAEAQAVASKRGGRLVSEDVPHCMVKVRWECANGHQWEASATQVVRAGTWCAQCLKSGIEEMRRRAAERGGKCLSTVYVNTVTKLEWQCSEGHIWQTKPNTALCRWCPICSHRRKLELAEIRRIARSKGGSLLSKDYRNNQTPLWWRCKEGHIWSAPAAQVKDGETRRGTWCAECYWLSKRGRTADPVTIEDLKEIARQRGGECLSEIYVSSLTKLKWRCAQGHEWMTTPAGVKQGHWCPHCRRLRFEHAQEAADRHGGRVLSPAPESVTAKSVLLWECAQGHQWNDTLARVREGRWCPYPECRYNRPFTLEDMQARARERGGQCLSSEYVNVHSPLRWMCSNGHVWENTPHRMRKGRHGRGTWCPVCAKAPKYGLEDMQKVARSRGGECLAKKTGNVDLSLPWRCAEGHVWKTAFSNILRGSWCRKCSNEARWRDAKKTKEHAAKSGPLALGPPESDAPKGAGTNGEARETAEARGQG